MATSRQYKQILTVNIAQHLLDDWFEKFEFYLLENELVIPTIGDNATADQVTARDEMQKKIHARFINSVELEVYSLMKTLVSPHDVNTQTYEQLKTVLVEHLSPKPTVLAERFKFYHTRQGASEKASEFLA